MFRPYPKYFEHNKSRPHTGLYLKNKIVKLCNRFKAKHIIDIGCGNGYIAKALIDRGFNLTCVEPSDSGFRNASELLPETNILKSTEF